MKSALFSLFKENLRPVWRFWQLWRSKMRFGQNVLRMTWKEAFVQFSWKAHCFLFLKRIWGQCDDFDNFDAQKCDLAKTFSAWPEKSVLYNFHEKRTLFSFWREFEASVTILTTLTLKNAIRSKRVAHDLKRAFYTIFIKSALFSLLRENWRPAWRFWQLWRSKMRFGQNVLRMAWKQRFVKFLWKAHCFAVLREFEASVLTTLTLKKAMPKRAPHKKAFVQFSWKAPSSLFFLRPAWRFWQLWRSQMRFGQNVPHDLERAFCTIFMKSAQFSHLERIWGQCDAFDNVDTEKCDSVKTCCAWPEKSVLYNFHGNCTVFLFWREF